MSNLYYGVAYYDEYISDERLDKDIELMLKANINVVRIAESTWSTLEPKEGIFNFHHIDRVLDAMHVAGISVIVGTPTYAIPIWLAKKYPEIMITDPSGHQVYGRRQIMDIMNPDFLRHSELVIRALVQHIHQHPSIIGYQVDNETKHYGNVGKFIQKAFVEHLQNRFPNIDEMNDKFGLDYWSNRINCWEDIPPIEGTINASLGNEFARFRRSKVKDYLEWQTKIIADYSRSEQFITQNFDYEWRGYSFGLQPSVDHFDAAKTMDIVSVDIYHPGQDHLTGREIAFGGDVARSTKDGKNYFVMETQAQGFPKWTPYPGQLRLQAFSHVSSGAKMVSYWHWHSIHNSYETYWKGLLSHDYEENPTYCEAKIIGKEFHDLSEELDSLSIENDVAIYVSNDAMEAMNWFRPDTPQPELNSGDHYIYNDVLRVFYDSLYDHNISVDFVNSLDADNCKYKLVVIPALYSATDSELEEINKYVEKGGRVLISFKSGFSNENVKVRSETQPGILNKSCNVSYSQFTIPDNVKVVSNTNEIVCDNEKPDLWMELLTPLTDETQVLLTYDHSYWKHYAAATLSKYGSGQALYLGFLPSKELTYELISYLVRDLTLKSKRSDATFPIVVKDTINKKGNTIRFVFNYSNEEKEMKLSSQYYDLLNRTQYFIDDILTLGPWDMKILTAI
ncbi:beta-galactosidase [Vibrio viridaestus]|uniref:Beta-galactosidase n=1 Tax=Vibrio viridaestus TaxID=2487322 RepID=A0A3N9TGN3_9VIBR|nr:beta-galactosidase [Vibrio viridaestus]RQW63339.1 beta-galactosidase [Vibrio viridaestus]